MRPRVGFFLYFSFLRGSCKRLLLLYGGMLSRKGRPKKISPPLFSRAEKQGRQKAGRYPDPGDYPGIRGYRAPSPQNREGTAAHYINNYNTGVHPAETFSRKTRGTPLSGKTRRADSAPPSKGRQQQCQGQVVGHMFGAWHGIATASIAPPATSADSQSTISSSHQAVMTHGNLITSFLSPWLRISNLI